MKTYDDMVKILAQESYNKIINDNVYFIEIGHIHTIFEVSSEQLRNDVSTVRKKLLDNKEDLTKFYPTEIRGIKKKLNNLNNKEVI